MLSLHLSTGRCSVAIDDAARPQANFIVNSSRRHRSLSRPLIDWDLIMVMEPTTMVGALVGGYMNKVSSSSSSSTVIAAFLSFLH
jgi:uncharacterized membrane protein YfcA